MELRLTHEAAIRVFALWYQFLVDHPGARALEDGTIKLDSVPIDSVTATHASRNPLQHAMDGSTVIAWYRAGRPATVRAIEEARNATQVLGLPRSLYVGKLIDIRRNQADRTIYMKMRTITRNGADGSPQFRTLNPSKGTLTELLINPTAADMAGAMGSQADAPATREVL